MKFLFFVSVFLLCIQTVHAKTYFVSNKGSDRNVGTDINEPFRTIKHATRQVEAGDTISLRAGTYYGEVLISRPATKKSWIKLIAYKDEHVVIDALTSQRAMYFYHKNNSPLYWEVSGLEIRGGESYVIKIDTPSVRIKNNNIHGSKADLIKLVGSADDVEIIGNTLHDNNAKPGANAQAVDIVGADRTLVANNHVYNIPSFGLYAKGSARGTIFENNYLHDIYESAIMLGQSSSQRFIEEPPYESYDGIIRNNIIVNTGRACLASASSKNVHIYNNSCYNVATRVHGAIYLSAQGAYKEPGTDIYIKNNIVVVSNKSNRPVIKLGPGAIANNSSLHLNNNIYWVKDGAKKPHFYIVDDDIYNASISKWRKIMAQDLNTKIIDPMYKELKKLQLSNSSPAINAGATLDMVKFDVLGNKRPNGNAYDIGAYEWSK